MHPNGYGWIGLLVADIIDYCLKNSKQLQFISVTKGLSVCFTNISGFGIRDFDEKKPVLNKISLFILIYWITYVVNKCCLRICIFILFQRKAVCTFLSVLCFCQTPSASRLFKTRDKYHRRSSTLDFYSDLIFDKLLMSLFPVSSPRNWHMKQNSHSSFKHV